MRFRWVAARIPPGLPLVEQVVRLIQLDLDLLQPLALLGADPAAVRGPAPEFLLLVGQGVDPTEQILDVIDKDVDIAMLVLAANPGPEGPGPIITTMAKTVGSFPIPVIIVPGDLSDEDIDGLS